jgi:inorganic pyrophosphatase/exopolyphosphatase
MKIVTSGAPYIDIDAYAACIGYAELLNLQGVSAQAISTSVINEGITPSLLKLSAKIETTYKQNENDSFIVLDVSDPEHIDTIVKLEQIKELIDHHPGFEQFWKNKSSVKTQIETIGSVCTIICEKFKEAGLHEKMTHDTAKLLLTGILENTLVFNSDTTTRRDKDAYEFLKSITHTDNSWTEKYFMECQQNIEKNLLLSLKNDTKLLEFSSFGKIAIGQLTVWDGKVLLPKYKDRIADQLSQKNSEWFLNLISLSDKKSYLFTKNTKVKEWLKLLLNIEFDNEVATDRMRLRKEIMRLALSFNTRNPGRVVP